MATEEKEDLMKKIQDQAQISIDDSMFEIKDDTADEVKDKPQDKLEDETEDKEKTKEPSVSDFEKEMKTLGLSKDGILAIIDDIVTKGAYEETKSCLGGKINFKLKSVKIAESGDFVRVFKPQQIQTQLQSEFQFNLATMGLVLIEHNGNSTGDTLEERMKYIEKNIASPTFRVILKEVFIFGRKLNLIGANEVADFF